MPPWDRPFLRPFRLVPDGGSGLRLPHKPHASSAAHPQAGKVSQRTTGGESFSLSPLPRKARLTRKYFLIFASTIDVQLSLNIYKGNLRFQ